MRVSDIKAGMMTGECKCERTFVEISAKSVRLLHVLRRGGGTPYEKFQSLYEYENKRITPKKVTRP